MVVDAYERLIRLDKRGTGMSDRVRGLPTLETRIDDLRVVMDAAGYMCLRDRCNARPRPPHTVTVV